MGDALDRVLARDPGPDQIVKIAHYGQGWPGCRLDAVVVLADVETIRARAGDRFVGELVTRQVLAGDIVARARK